MPGLCPHQLAVEGAACSKQTEPEQLVWSPTSAIAAPRSRPKSISLNSLPSTASWCGQRWFQEEHLTQLPALHCKLVLAKVVPGRASHSTPCHPLQVGAGKGACPTCSNPGVERSEALVMEYANAFVTELGSTEHSLDTKYNQSIKQPATHVPFALVRPWRRW